MGIKFANSAFATLAAGINSSVTSITLTTGQGARFPSLAGGDYFFATLIDTSNNLEIVKCTARATDVLTVVRAQESTTARAFATGDRIELRVTAGGLVDLAGELLAKASNLSDLTNVTTARTNLGLAAVAASGSATDLSGTLAKARMPSGSVLQVVNYQENGRYAYSGSWHDTAITATITPTSASSKILCLVQLGRAGWYGNNTLAFRMLRNGSLVGVGAVYGSRIQTTAVMVRSTTDNNHTQGACFLSFLDSPSTTSALTYKMQAQQESNAEWYLNRNGSNTDSSNEYNSTSQSNITLMEIAG